MVEDVEHLASELETEPFGDLSILGDGEVSIEETWAGDGVAPEGSRMAAAGNDGVIVAARGCRGGASQAGPRKSCV